MIRSKSPCTAWCAGLALMLGFVAQLPAAPVTYVIDYTQSVLTLSGSFQGAPFSAQTPSGLVVDYLGAITGDLVGSTLSLSGGNAVIAFSNADAAVIVPAGVGVTNYGVQIAAIPGQVGAYRDVILDITSGSATDGVAGGQTWAFSSGKLDYAGPATGPGSLSLIGAAAPNASLLPISLSTVGLEETLRIPLMLTMNDNAGLIQTLQGEIVAVRAVPEPSTIALIAWGGLTLVVARRRGCLCLEKPNTVNCPPC